MAVELQSPPETPVTVTETLSGILEDMQTLLHQQLAMVRAEVRSDWLKAKAALGTTALGIGVLLVGAPLLSSMAVFLLHQLTAHPGTDPARLPLWACFGIVGGLLCLAGGCLTWTGIRKFQSFNPLPEESVRALEENLQWQTKKN